MNIDEETKIKLMVLINEGTKDRSFSRQGWELGETLGLNMYEFLAGQNISKEIEEVLYGVILDVESDALDNFGSKEYCEVYRNCEKLFGEDGDWFYEIFVGARGESVYREVLLRFGDALIDLFPKEADIKKTMGKFYPSTVPYMDKILFRRAEEQSQEIISEIVKAYMLDGFPFCKY